MPRCPKCGTQAPAYILRCVVCDCDFLTTESPPANSADAPLNFELAPQTKSEELPQTQRQELPQTMSEALPPAPAAIEAPITPPSSEQRQEVLRLVVVAAVGVLLAAVTAILLMRNDVPPQH